MTKTDPMPFLRKHFPDYGVLDFDLPEGFVDASSGVEACPSFQSEELEVRLFADYRDPEFRVHEGTKRFWLARTADGLLGRDPPTVINTDSYAEILAAVETLRAETAPRPR